MVVCEVEVPVHSRLGEHLQSRRGLTLVLHREHLTAAETAHLEKCATCNRWLTTFTALAKKAGFPIAFRIPPGPARPFVHAHSTQPESVI